MDRPPLHVLFTMDCFPASPHSTPAGPVDWIQSARAIEGYCDVLRSAGFPATLFVCPQILAEHQPLLEDLASLGAELALEIHPPSLPRSRRGRFLGQYSGVEQRMLIEIAASAYEEILGEWPRSVRSAMFSASDETFPLLFELGFRQGSISSPGRRVGKHAALWEGAETDPHYVDQASRLRKGAIPFLELPVTTDALQTSGGVSPDLAVENGTVDAWHRPLVEGQLQRFEREGVAFRTLCFLTSNRHLYGKAGDRLAEALTNLVEYVSSLEQQHTLVPTTLSGAHALFRLSGVVGSS